MGGKKLKVVNPSASDWVTTTSEAYNKILVKRTPSMISTPEWAVHEPGYLDVAYDMNLQEPKVIVVEYLKQPDEGCECNPGEGFSRIYVVERDGKPFNHMDGIWSEIHNKIISSGMSSGAMHIDVDNDGKMTCEGKYLVAQNAWSVVNEVASMYRSWKEFPNVKDYPTVRKLLAAKDKIFKLNGEDRHGWIASQIKACQTTIESERKRISELEKDLNKIYEDAADAMNLFEENGIEPVMKEDGDPEKTTGSTDSTLCDLDFASLYSTPTIKFVGDARITTLPSGNIRVIFPIIQPYNLTKGDMVVDSVSGKQAIYCGNGNWKLIG